MGYDPWILTQYPIHFHFNRIFHKNRPSSWGPPLFYRKPQIPVIIQSSLYLLGGFNPLKNIWFRQLGWLETHHFWQKEGSKPRSNSRMTISMTIKKFPRNMELLPGKSSINLGFSPINPGPLTSAATSKSPSTSRASKLRCSTVTTPASSLHELSFATGLQMTSETHGTSHGFPWNWCGKPNKKHGFPMKTSISVENHGKPDTKSWFFPWKSVIWFVVFQLAMWHRGSQKVQHQGMFDQSRDVGNLVMYGYGWLWNIPNCVSTIWDTWATTRICETD